MKSSDYDSNYVKLGMTVRVRFAPSPTGYAHIGFLSRILINYALARKYKGQFVWRNEDTDTKRFVPGSLEFNMKWVREFGLDWDEGPDKGGPYAPYNQTERKDLYKKSAEDLIQKGYAYRCFCTEERLAKLKADQELLKKKTGYDRKCRKLTEEEVKANMAMGLPYTIRLKVPENRKIEFDDIITHNHITWNSNDVQDYILLKSDGNATYHLCSCVDDVAMKITHVFRGTEWVSTTPVHVLVYEGMGLSQEDYHIGHFTVILDPDTNKKFSKRDPKFKINSLSIQGYLKPAVLNYLMLQGWAPKDNRELFTLEEFVEAFDLSGMQKANPTWNPKKLDWFNGVYMRELSKEKYTKEFLNWIEKYLLPAEREDLVGNLVSADVDESRMDSYLGFAKSLLKSDSGTLSLQLGLVQERAVSFWQALQQIEFFYVAPQNINWKIKQLEKVGDKVGEIKARLLDLHLGLDNEVNKWTHEEWEAGIRKIAEEFGQKHGDVFMVLRVAIVGGPYSPPLFESLQLLGKEETTKRLN